MIKKFEQFLIWYLPALLISRVPKIVMIPFLAERYASGDNSAFIYSLTYLAFIGTILERIVAAVWIWKNGIRKQNKILWTAFALFTGLWGVLFFFAALIYERITLNNLKSLNDTE